jgi:hypothetical protein
VIKIDNRTGSRANKRILAITVYYTTSKILIQGNFCQTWLSNEFEHLQNFVNSINCRNSTPDQGLIPPFPDFELGVDLPKINAPPTCSPRVHAKHLVTKLLHVDTSRNILISPPVNDTKGQCFHPSPLPLLRCLISERE